MKLFLICIFSLSLLTPLSGHTADSLDQFSVRGAGLIDCTTFKQELHKKSPEYLMMGGWIDGYITGINKYAPETYDATSFESTELFAEFTKNHCQKNPQDSLYAVINSIIDQRWEDRIKRKSQLVGVQLGEYGTQLYTETITRMQKKLATKGFYKLPITGQFDSETITALAAFQKTIKGYKATGFPDQATLWALFTK
jgi:hypothetical protein